VKKFLYLILILFNILFFFNHGETAYIGGQMVVVDNDCNQSQYYLIGCLCQDADELNRQTVFVN